MPPHVISFMTENEYTRAKNHRRKLTPAEHKLWLRLKAGHLNGRHFYRQRPIGPFIVDFCCPSANLVIEVDGYHHFRLDGAALDVRRTKFLRRRGFRVIRFRNQDVLQDIETVIKTISRLLPNKKRIKREAEDLPLNPLPWQGRGKKDS